jgi:hypothetical protein
VYVKIKSSFSSRIFLTPSKGSKAQPKFAWQGVRSLVVAQIVTVKFACGMQAQNKTRTTT